MFAVRVRLIPIVVAGLLTVLLCASDPGLSRAYAQRPEKGAPEHKGLVRNTRKAFDGYTLIAPLLSKQTILVNIEGQIVHSWEADCTPGQSAYLLENGNLLRPGKLNGKDQKFTSGGDAGRVQEYTWDGDLVWDFKLHNDKQLAHHDICRLPNGNILVLVWEKKTSDEMIECGRKPGTIPSQFMLVDTIVEIKPTGKKSGKIVWEWRIWDHLIQDHDKNKANFGDVAAHPELVDINFGEEIGRRSQTDKKMPEGKDDAKKGGSNQFLKLPGGYVGGGSQIPSIPDWSHVNTITYHPKFDQIMLTSRSLSEVWIIDHSTTTAEATTHRGGRSGKGGDLLYRWGNPASYRAGKSADQKLFAPHAAHWIPAGLPGEGHVLVFNNGGETTARNYSSVDEIALPVDEKGNYARKADEAFAPEKLEWSFSAPKKTDFVAEYFSNAQRLPNGNTLICSGVDGVIFEVSPDKEIVWEFVNPIEGKVDVAGKGSNNHGDETPPKFGTIIPDELVAMMKLTPKQKEELAAFQKEIFKDIDKLLTAAQKKMFDNPRSLGNVEPPVPGKLFTFEILRSLKMTEDQKDAMSELRIKVDRKLRKLLTEDQRILLESVGSKSKDGNKSGGSSGGGKTGRPWDKGHPFSGRQRDESNAVFKTLRYGPKYMGLEGKELKPLPPLPKEKELVPVVPRQK